MTNYIVATIKPWNIEAYYSHRKTLPGNWDIATSPEELSLLLARITPEYIFFPHWSWIVPEEIISKYECICFHMTDVPYGRGGSPLQNLIARGHKKTKLTALKMISELDAGPVYCKSDVILEGCAQDIYEDIANKVYDIISQIIENTIIPTEQEGEIVIFDRRTPDQSELPKHGSINHLYDHIRMLDAETYPRAFIDYGDFRLELSNAVLKDDEIIINVRIKRGFTQ